MSNRMRDKFSEKYNYHEKIGDCVCLCNACVGFCIFFQLENRNMLFVAFMYDVGCGISVQIYPYM